MAVLDLEEQEQLASMKAWWAKYGNLVSGVVLTLALAIAGWQAWNYYRHSKNTEASVLYFGLLDAATLKDAAKVRQLSGELLERFEGTLYADLGALMAVRDQLQSDPDSARSKLEWVATKGSDPLLRDFARLRLATLQLDRGELESALKSLEAEPAAGLEPRFFDLRGDVLFAQGKRAEAAAAYRKAFEALKDVGEAESFRAMVELKLDALGGAQ